MLNYEECKKIAENRAERMGISLNKAYILKNAFVFDNDTIVAEGPLPFVVDRQDGSIHAL